MNFLGYLFAENPWTDIQNDMELSPGRGIGLEQTMGGQCGMIQALQSFWVYVEGNGVDYFSHNHTHPLNLVS